MAAIRNTQCGSKIRNTQNAQKYAIAQYAAYGVPVTLMTRTSVQHTPYETLPLSGRVANTPRRSLLVRTPPRPTARSPQCTPFELRPRCAGGVRPGGFFPGGSPSSSPQPRCPAHAQPTGTRQNRHRLMSSSFPSVWLRRAQSDLSAPSPPRSPTSAINSPRSPNSPNS